MRSNRASVLLSVFVPFFIGSSVAAVQGICEPPLPDPPPEVCSLDDGIIFVEALDQHTLLWQQENGFDRFNLYRGLRGDLADADHDGALDANGACLQNGTAGLTYADFLAPPPGDAFLYLVTGVGPAGESDLGQASSGAERPNATPCGAGYPPVIESVAVVQDSVDRVARCDLTAYLKGLLCANGIPSGMFVEEPAASLTVGYSGAHLTARVTDPDSIPGHEDVLLVAAEFPLAAPGAPDPLHRDVTLLDDGGSLSTPFPQISAAAPEACGGDPECPSCSPAIYPLTSGDSTAEEHSFTRALAFVTTQGTFEGLTGITSQGHYPLALDCIAASGAREPIFIQRPAGESVPFLVQAVDRAGNLDTWPGAPSLILEQTRYSCEADDCTCCILLSDSPSAECVGRQGLVGVAGSGFENGFCIDLL
jgi:hypothetical protein